MKTKKHFRLSVTAIFFLALVVALSSCSKKDVRTDEAFADDGSGEGISSGGEVGTEGLGGTSGSSLATVYFDYDSYTIRSDARESLKANAQWLKQSPKVRIQVEGHCDERGSTEYNLALGERRANAVKSYLSQMGVGGNRVSIISYGEERPANPASNESAWAENRRAEFVITQQ